MFDFPTFNGMLRANRLQDAINYALRHDMALDEHVRANLAQAREHWAGKADRDRGINRPLNDSERARRLAALRAFQNSK